jgi:hypothetical protein
VRAFLAAAGLLVLAGSALAGRPTAHTLRKSPAGPIAAIAQDNKMAAWFTSSTKGACNGVHILSPGKKDRILPQPLPGTETCNWVVAGWPPQLAVASQISTALWTLHEQGPAPNDDVIAATTGGPQRVVHHLARASDGTGDWLGGVAGAGRTLAYSWDDVEYVNPQKCLATGQCKRKIADGGIRLVTRTSGDAFAETPLPGAGPALLLAAAGGRIAYVPATTVKANRPATSANNTLQIADATTGAVVGQAPVHGFPIAIALSSQVLAVLTTQGTSHDRISWFSATDGKKLGNLVISGSAAPQLAANDRLIVYRVGLWLRDISTRTGRPGKLVKTSVNYLGLSLAKGRLLWAENHNGTGRLRALDVG